VTIPSTAGGAFNRRVNAIRPRKEVEKRGEVCETRTLDKIPDFQNIVTTS
jgi:hypothetical protein